MANPKDSRNQPCPNPGTDPNADAANAAIPRASYTDPQQPLIDRLISHFVALGNDEQTRELGAELVSVWLGIERPNECGLLLHEEMLDPDRNMSAPEILEGHVSEERLQEISQCEDLTDEELDLWRRLVAGEFFSNQQDGSTAWEIAEIVSTDGEKAFVAHLWDGEESSCLGVYGSIPDAEHALMGLGYTSIEDFQQRYPEKPVLVDVPASLVALEEAREHERKRFEELGFADEFRYFQICGKCHRLHEVGRPDSCNQHCSCTRVSEPTWPRHDFNERAHLCSCCARVVLRSGSRFSPFFCSTCESWVRAATLWVGRLVVPIGRHTLMHTWVPEMPSGRLDAYGGRVEKMAEAFATALPPFFEAMGRLEEWYPIVMGDNLRRLGITGEISLHDYLMAVLRRGTALPAKETTFSSMCRFLRATGKGKRPGRRVDPEGGGRDLPV